MNKLYVSDLDGTLLNGNAELHMYDVNTINEMIGNGINFTVSTGRGATTVKILDNINLKFPVMMLNGAVCYDFTKKEYVNAKYILAERVKEISRKNSYLNLKSSEVHTLKDNKLFHLKMSDWNGQDDCLDVVLVDNRQAMEEAAKILAQIEGITFYIHKSVYEDNVWFCDITAENVTKAESLRELKEQYNFDKVIAFGDSENDLPLAEAADEFYAVENAAEIVKSKATSVIGSSADSGVIKHIIKMEELPE